MILHYIIQYYIMSIYIMLYTSRHSPQLTFQVASRALDADEVAILIQNCSYTLQQMQLIRPHTLHKRWFLSASPGYYIRDTQWVVCFLHFTFTFYCIRLYNIISCRIILHLIISHLIISYYIMSYHIISYHIK